MKITRLLKLSSLIMLTLGLAFGVWNCSSSEDEEQLNSKPAEESAAPPATDEEATEQAKAQAETPIQLTEVEPQIPTADATPEPVPASIPAAAPAPTEPISTDKVVRYVKTTGVKVFDQPNGKKVKMLNKGDHILVSIQGKWAVTVEGQYIATKDLSEKAVPRKFNKINWRH